MQAINYVAVAFPEGNRLYTYRTTQVFEPKDLLVVPSPRGPQLVRVHHMLPIEKVKLDVPFEYKWVIQKVDFTEYDKLTESTDSKARL